MKALFFQKVTGGERKHILAPIAEKFERDVQYAGAPTFAYQAADWSVDKNNMVVSPVFEIESELEQHAGFMELLQQAGMAAEGQLAVTILPGSADEEKAGIMQALLESKGSLIRKSLQTEEHLAVSAGAQGYTFAFYNATLDHRDIVAAVQFAFCIHEQSLQQKRVTSKDKAVDNEKYAFRCFLLRIGMIGKEYTVARKALSKHLSGNSSFKSGERKQPAEAADQPAAPGMDSVEEVLADAALIHGVNELIEQEGQDA